MRFVTSALVLESYRKHRVATDYALKRDIIAMRIGRDLLAERVHHQKICNLHSAPFWSSEAGKGLGRRAPGRLSGWHGWLAH